MQVSRGAQIDHGDQVVNVAEAKRASDNRLDDVVLGLKFAGGQSIFQRCDDMFLVSSELFGE